MFALDLVSLPESLDDLVGDWLNLFPPGQCKVALLGGTALCWTIWKTRNAACSLNEIFLMILELSFPECVIILSTRPSCRKSKGKEALMKTSS